MTIVAEAPRIASATSCGGRPPSMIVAPRLGYLDSTSSSHPRAAACSFGCLPNAFVVVVANLQVCRRQSLERTSSTQP